MLTLKKWSLVLVAIIFMMGITGCGKDGPAERTGKKIDEAAESAKKKVKKIFD